MDLFEAINKRGTYRGPYTDEKIPRDDIIKIVETGICAPSGCNAQTTSFIIVDDEALLNELSQIVSNNAMKDATCVIVVVSDLTPCFAEMSFYKEDYSAAVENMYLAATALGYGICWVDGALRSNRIAQKISNLLDVDDDKLCTVVLPMGIPVNNIIQKEKKSFNERAFFNKYNT